MNSFQLSVLVIAIALLLIGVLIFAGILPGFRAPSGGVGGTVTLWGTLPAETIRQPLEAFSQAHKSEFTLVYEEKDERTFQADLVNALAADKGPDLVILPSSEIIKQADKLLPLSYDSYSLPQFQKTFIPGGQLYLAPEGVLGLPLYIDPLVLYDNQDLLTTARLANVPKTWNDLQAVTRSLSVVDARKNITQSAIALGQFNNITNAKDILAMLIMQAGNPITLRPTGAATGLQVVIKENYDFPTPPAAEAVAFFNRFSDPENTLYSWNSALPEARKAFLQGTLAFYLGYASDWTKLKQENPQLNFDVNVAPQRQGATSLTFGQVMAAAVLKRSKNSQTAMAAAVALSGADFEQALSEAINLPPARKDLLGVAPADPAMSVFYQSAIIARGWLDPEPAKTQDIFRQLSEGVQVGSADLTTALTRANGELETLTK